jgi:heavy metal sensor kinase
MMRSRSIGSRLTMWYFAVLAVALIAFGAGTWFAMRASLYAAVDDSLRDRVQGVARFIEVQGGSLAPEEMRDEFREHSVLGPGGDLFQVSDNQGAWLYRSAHLEDANIPADPTEILKAGPRFETLWVKGVPLRFLSSNVWVRGKPYAVQVAVSLHELNEGLDRFLWILLAAIPIVLAVATAGAYWMSRRALAPVDEITTAARSIGVQNLSHRLPVPPTADELQRLSTTLNAMFERLDAAFGRITRFTADASHELRTPIAFMRTTAEVALRKQRSEEQYRSALVQILAELERTSALVEDLLLLARADSGAQMQVARIDLIQTVAEACHHGRVLADAKGVQFRWQPPAETLAVHADREAIRRVLLILIDNAVKYTGAGGQVHIAMAQQDDSAIIEVHDSGIGISEQDLPHIFDRFYRADKARSNETGGAGLGLAIAQWIVSAHRGEIRVRSHMGGGSRFTVVLPRAV